MQNKYLKLLKDKEKIEVWMKEFGPQVELAIKMNPGNYTSDEEIKYAEDKINLKDINDDMKKLAVELIEMETLFRLPSQEGLDLKIANGVARIKEY